MLRDHFHELAESLGEDPDAKQALCEPDRELFLEQRTEWERLVMHYIGWKIENRIVEEDDPLIDFYFKLVKFANLMTREGRRVRAPDRADARRPETQRSSARTRRASSAASSTRRTPRSRSPPRSSRSTSTASSSAFRPIGRRSCRCRRRSRATNRKIVVISDVDTTYKQRAN